MMGKKDGLHQVRDMVCGVDSSEIYKDSLSSGVVIQVNILCQFFSSFLQLPE